MSFHIPREPFIFTDADTIDAIADIGPEPVTLYRHVDGIIYKYHNCLPEFHDDAVVYHVERALVSWTIKAKLTDWIE